jgi:type II secretory pathway pseudopilin PulG
MCEIRGVKTLSARSSVSLRALRAFTLIDVLVTISVVAVLIAMLLPALSSVREAANQVVCRSNVRQIGIGTALYAEANADSVMPSTKVTSDSSSDQSWDTVVLRVSDISPGASGPTSTDHWDGVGILYSESYLPAPKLFYCPSHSGSTRFGDYADRWAGQPGEIVGNYQYRVRAPLAGASGTVPVPTTTKLTAMASSSALVCDGLKSVQDFNHKIGANLLHADISVSWFSDPSGSILAILAQAGQSPNSSVQQAWDHLDRTNNSVVRIPR